MPKHKRRTLKPRNPYAVELWSPKYRQRIVRDQRKHTSKVQCRTLYQQPTSEEA